MSDTDTKLLNKEREFYFISILLVTLLYLFDDLCWPTFFYSDYCQSVAFSHQEIVCSSLNVFSSSMEWRNIKEESEFEETGVFMKSDFWDSWGQWQGKVKNLDTQDAYDCE